MQLGLNLPSMMTSFKFVNGPPAIFLVGWVIYILIYWRTLWKVLLLKQFDTNDRILWFLVITMAPLIGIITFWLQVNQAGAAKNADSDRS